MTTDEALSVIEKHRGDVSASYRCPEWDDNSERECVWHVTLWWQQPRGDHVGILGAGDTLPAATLAAWAEIEWRKARAAEGATAR